jgi:hypothetical protein
VYMKSSHTGPYLNFHSNHPPHVKRGVTQNLYSRATTVCQERHDLARELSNLKADLQLNGFPQKLTDAVISSTGGNNRSRNEVKPIGSVVIPYVKGISEKFKRIGNHYIRTIFKTKHTLRDTLMRTRPIHSTLHL